MSILNVDELSVEYTTARGAVNAVSSVSLGLQKGETIGMVGESGCDKSTFGLSILRLLPPPGHITSGRALYNNTDLVTADEITLRKVRGREISMVFQDPSATLNPLMRIRDHFLELYAAHPRISRE
jgi:peptide/nickel transport system ATP-binding protein